MLALQPSKSLPFPPSRVLNLPRRFGITTNIGQALTVAFTTLAGPNNVVETVRLLLLFCQLAQLSLMRPMNRMARTGPIPS